MNPPYRDTRVRLAERPYIANTIRAERVRLRDHAQRREWGLLLFTWVLLTCARVRLWWLERYDVA